ncbi:SDR family oxidoreductase [Scytonema sp. NUACC26]|uniref:SDR family oxidoreductase n=1 Tax=Scytonema sp. NUACC26 TaxID=3140176 RepID=UPI0034DC1064
MTEDLVLVAGATGGVGQLTVGKLLEKGLKVRVLTRNSAKAEKMFERKVEVAVGDTRDPSTLPTAVQDVAYIICCTGTTAFPSERWDFEPKPNSIEWVQLLLNSSAREARAKNSPLKVDAQGVSHLVRAAPRNLKRFVFVSSCGVLHKSQFPYSILNAFGVLDAKLQGEEAIISSGLPYTIIRPGRLIDGPYTSYDLNTLLKATTESKSGVVLGTGDTLTGQTSRIDVAAACVECIQSQSAERKAFEIINKGKRPSVIDWDALFAQL